jgi:hypothetical protein
MNPFESNGSTYMRTAFMRDRITNNEKNKQQKEKKKAKKGSASNSPTKTERNEEKKHTLKTSKRNTSKALKMVHFDFISIPYR